MTVYVDAVFALNLLVDWLLLKCAVALTGAGCRRLRLWLAALVGALYAVAVLLPGCAFFGSLPGRLAAYLGMCAVAFGVRRQALRPALWYFGVCCGFFGLCYAVTTLTGNGVWLFGGAAWYAVRFRDLALLAGLCWAVVGLLLPRIGRHGPGALVELTLHLDGRSVPLRALRDTGNCLRDPLTGAPVLVADLSTAQRLLPGLPLRRELLEDPAAALPLLAALRPGLRTRLIPYRTVGSEGALLLGFRCAYTTPRRKKPTPILLAVSPTPVSDGGLYQALTGGTL